MPVVIPGPTTGPDANAVTSSPFSLRLNGVWVRLEGVTPGVSRSAERPRSEFVSVDGVRHVQQAPRFAREWSLDYRWATPAAVAALGLAAEAPGDVWLADDSSLRANMLAPRDCYGHDPLATVVDCGGIPLRALPAGVAASALVRGGVTTTLAAWTTSAEGTVLATIGASSLLAPAGTGARQATVAFTLPADEVLTIAAGPGVVSGLMLTEGTPAAMWLSGERMPCKVSVSDAERTLNRLAATEQGRADYSVTLREVG